MTFWSAKLLTNFNIKYELGITKSRSSMNVTVYISLMPLSVFTEIERMESRLVKLEDSDKNKKPLSKALERLEKKLTGLKYERIPYLGKPYKEGMVCEARFIPSNDPVHKVPTITRVIKPYISYCGEKIQTAEIEVSECG